MDEWHRRSVLTTGAALSAAGLASIAASTEPDERSDDDLPNPDLEPNPELDEDWASYRGDAGHARFVRDGYAFDGDDLEAAWSADYDGSVAVADDTVYTTTADGVVALDAADGSLVWENTDVDASSPAVAGEMVYLYRNGGGIVALDREDGSVRWESDLGAEDVSAHTVAYGGVFVVADGTLYALEAEDGSVRWQHDSVFIEMGDGDEWESEFTTGTAAANGVVYAGTGNGLLAFDPETGDEVWQIEARYPNWTGNDIHATTAGILVEYSDIEYRLHDAQTGETLRPVTSETPHEPALGDGSAITGTNYTYHSRSIRGDEYDWELDVTYTYGQAVISGETVYVYFYVDGHNYGDRDYDRKLVALDKRDGSEKWALSRDDAPIGHVRAISGETIYVDHDGELVALRERADDEDAADEGEENEDDEQEGEGSDDSTEGGDEGESDDEDGNEDAGESDDTDGDEDASGDTDEDTDETDGADCECPEEESDAGSSEDDSSDESEDTDDGADGDGSADDGDADGADPTENATTVNATTNAEDAANDGVPGFTTGAGLLGGALGLEWLRRRDDADEPTE